MKIILNDKNLVYFLLPEDALVQSSSNGISIKFTEKIKAPKEGDEKTIVEHDFERSLFVPQLNSENSSVIEKVTAPAEKFFAGKFEYVKGKFSVVKGWKDPA